MTAEKKRKTLCWILLILNLAFIWGNSLLPGEVSGAISRWLKELLSLGTDDPEAGHGLLRKFAHFMEFCTLGMLLTWLWDADRSKWWIPLLCGMGAACVDETIQCFVPDRGPAVTDVCIDTAGVAVGILLFSVGNHMYHKTQKRRN